MKNFTITLNGVDRHFAVELSGVTRSFEIRQGVGPAGPTGATGPAGPNSVTSATTSDGTAELEVLTLAAVNGISTSGENAYISTDGASASISTSGDTANIFTNGENATISTNGINGDISTSGENANIITNGINGNIQTRATFRLFDGTYATTLSHTPTADRAVAFPDASGTLLISSQLGTGVATFLATPTSANLAAAVTDETGSGSLVFSNAPTFTGGLQFSSSAVGATSRTNLGFISAYKTTNEARSSSTLAYDTDLQITLKANTNYVIECLLDSTVASGGTLTQNFVYSGTLSVGGEGSSTAGFFGTTRLTWNAASTQSVPIIGMAFASATTPRTILHKLTLRTNTTGTFAVQWSNAAGTGTTTINARSYLTAYEV